jgi:hypothetical protein
MPSANHSTILDNAFGEWESQVRAMILECVEFLVPVEERDIEPFQFYISSNAAFRYLVDCCRSNPLAICAQT